MFCSKDIVTFSCCFCRSVDDQENGYCADDREGVLQTSSHNNTQENICHENDSPDDIINEVFDPEIQNDNGSMEENIFKCDECGRINEFDQIKTRCPCSVKNYNLMQHFRITWARIKRMNWKSSRGQNPF